MKTNPCLILAAACSLFLTASSLADAPAAIRVLSADSFKDRAKASKVDDVELWGYHVVLQNDSGHDLEGLELRYRVFYFEELDSRGKPFDAMIHLEDKVAVPVLKKQEKKTVNTKLMDYATGGNKAVRAERDVWKGIWIRVFDEEGKELGSLVKPVSFMKSHPWK